MKTKVTLRKVHRRLAWQGYFFMFVLWLLFMHSGSDHMVTGIIDPTVPSDVFHAYVAWESGLNLGYAGAVAVIAYLFGAKKWTAALMFVQLVWVWFGGALDILWFMIHGSLPALKTLLWWIFPWWQWWMHLAYAASWIILLLIAWTIYHKHKKSRGSWA